MLSERRYRVATFLGLPSSRSWKRTRANCYSTGIHNISAVPLIAVIVCYRLLSPSLMRYSGRSYMLKVDCKSSLLYDPEEVVCEIL